MKQMSEGVVISFLFGLIYGSFLNVVIYRFDDWLSILKGRSHCPHCQQTLAWFDLMPLVSFLALRGRCRYCQRPISWQYPAVEIATAILLAAGYWLVFTSGLPLWRELMMALGYVVVVGGMMTIFWHDLKEMMIPDVLTNISLIGAAIFSFAWRGGWLSPVLGLLVGLVPIALLVYPSREKWMGQGDVKLAAALGLWLGYPQAIVALVAAFLLGGGFGVIGLTARRLKLKQAVPFGPFLIAGALIGLFAGEQLIIWYLGSIGYGYY